jgi:hypothetical protein
VRKEYIVEVRQFIYIQVFSKPSPSTQTGMATIKGESNLIVNLHTMKLNYNLVFKNIELLTTYLLRGKSKQLARDLFSTKIN